VNQPNAATAVVASLVLIERGTNRRTKSSLTARTIPDRRGDRAELAKHFALQKRRRVLQTKGFQRALGEIPKHDARVVVENVE
jgi:23S rRNA A2030 N6-methylase RlmJ